MFLPFLSDIVQKDRDVPKNKRVEGHLRFHSSSNNEPDPGEQQDERI